MSKEAMTLALEALRPISHNSTDDPRGQADKAIKALEEALAKQEQGEPVGQLLEDAFGRGQVMWFNKPKDESMLYTTPQPAQKPWVGLTNDDDIDWDGTGNLKQLVEAVEAKLKEKNSA